jgi:hypothetical protein
MKVVSGTGLLVLLAGTLAHAQGCDRDVSRQEVQRLTSAGIVVSVDQFLPNVTVVVDERRWGRSEPEAKRSIARHVDCAVTGATDNMLRRVIIRSRGENQVLGTYSNNELKPP